MSVDRVKFQDIVESQLPRYVREEFPLNRVSETVLYLTRESKVELLILFRTLISIPNWIRFSIISNETELFSDVSYTDTTINTSVDGNFTVGFPDNHGLIQIDDEIIYYESKTDKTFEGCVRGFCAITSYTSPGNPEELVFETSVTNVSTRKLQNCKEPECSLPSGVSQEDQETSSHQVLMVDTFNDNVDQKNFIINADTFYQV